MQDNKGHLDNILDHISTHIRENNMYSQLYITYASRITWMRGLRKIQGIKMMNTKNKKVGMIETKISKRFK